MFSGEVLSYVLNLDLVTHGQLSFAKRSDEPAHICNRNGKSQPAGLAFKPSSETSIRDHSQRGGISYSLGIWALGLVFSVPPAERTAQDVLEMRCGVAPWTWGRSHLTLKA